ncbi:response regulator [Paenibacillus alvei]|uniref:response regulator n=1 Tax=Paenibacillus alvei TaxID=44250 RepID=UPI0013DC5656|nr:response regulator [Paenibacillus alvei]MBG9737585.1 response regulator receiver protein [Paenibacillus alvei]MBG9747277.1 response regulator receiver protein [Paenibacillus alvei]MCY9581237.1 response regulator [Paenibacillus alvei]MCY9584474.1 response regulator [Paenibacillus alvei]NEZ40628.1 response regulator [Paenibacillus alvei]
MNLLIVEDETRFLQNLLHMPWEDHDIEVVGSANNGAEALAQIQIKQPDIILMDIQMPEMDGLSLACQVARDYSSTKIIILSGHDKFSYAQTAVELGVYKYLLKPAAEMDILQSVTDAARCIQAELMERTRQLMMQEQWTQYLPILHQHTLRNLAYGKYQIEDLEASCASLGLHIDIHSRYAVIVLDVDEQADSSNENGMTMDKLVHFIRNHLPIPDYYVCTEEDKAIIVIGRAGSLEQNQQQLFGIHIIMEKLIRNIKQCLGIVVSAGISGGTGKIDELLPLYIQAKKALQNRVVYGTGIAIPYDDPLQAEFTNRPNYEHEDKQLEMALEALDQELAMRMISNMCEAVKNNSASYEIMMEQLMYIVGVLTLFIRKRGWSVQDVTGEDFDFLSNVQSLTTPERMYDVLHRAVRSIISYAESHDRKVTHPTVQAIIELLETEQEQEFTLHTIADRFYVNASYLSRLFKQETGMPFTSYVLEHKMERARTALMNGARVYDAAAMIGYRDVSYFTKIFRKYWGVTPSSVKNK